MTTSTIHQNMYTIHAGNNSTDLGKVGISKTILGAKRVGRATIRAELPNGEGVYSVRDADGHKVFGGERSIRTGFQWVER